MSENEQAELIGTNIERLLKLNNMKQNELADILGVTESAVGKWVLGKSVPRMGTIQKIANHFDIQKSDILNNKPYKSDTDLMHPKRMFLMDKIQKADDAKLRKIEKLMELIDDEEARNY